MTLIVFFILLGVLILSHEFGHFIAAKRSRVLVEEFGIGLPPRLFGIRKGETLYSFNLLPLGGFVRLWGEDRPSEENNDRSFYSKKFKTKFLILAAGVLMNIVVAYLLFVGVHIWGVPTLVQEEITSGQAYVIVTEAIPDSPAYKAGIKAGDIISKLETRDGALRPHSAQEIQNFVAGHDKEEITVYAKRDGKEFQVSIQPQYLSETAKPSLGVGLVQLTLQKSPWYRAIWEGFVSTIQALAATIQALVYLATSVIIGTFEFKNIAGPVGIFQLTSQIYSLGTAYFLQFAAILSINLAVLNFLPLPGLDGGRALILFIEKIRRKTLNPELVAKLHGAGIAFLILLILLITYHDVQRLL